MSDLSPLGDQKRTLSQRAIMSAYDPTKCNNADQCIVEYETSSSWVLVVRGS